MAGFDNPNKNTRDHFGTILDPEAEFTEGAVKAMTRLMTARTYWKVPADILEHAPSRLVAYIKTLDPAKQLSAFDKATRLLMKMIDQNIAQGRQEIQFLGPRAGQQIEQDSPESPPEQPQQIAHLETPTLQDAAKTAQILHDLGIFDQIAKSHPEVLEGDSEPSE